MTMPKAKTEQEKAALQRVIASTDRQIDDLVCDLYGLTKDEIQIVEGAHAAGTLGRAAADRRESRPDPVSASGLCLRGSRVERDAER
jgi:hypothetical protein